MSIVDRIATYDDILALPENLVGELIDGELFASPRPSSRHARSEGLLYNRLSRAFDDGDGGPGGWWIVIEPELHLGSDVLVPDIAGWRRERLPVFPDVAYFDLAPDWICEVISPSTTRLDRVKKLPRYARNGVEHAWIVDPILRTLEVYRRDGNRFEPVDAYSSDALVRAEPFEALELALATLWLPPPTPKAPEG
jgi:Uma2 family endonuclease